MEKRWRFDFTDTKISSPLQTCFKAGRRRKRNRDWWRQENTGKVPTLSHRRHQSAGGCCLQTISTSLSVFSLPQLFRIQLWMCHREFKRRAVFWRIRVICTRLSSTKQWFGHYRGNCWLALLTWPQMEKNSPRSTCGCCIEVMFCSAAVKQLRLFNGRVGLVLQLVPILRRLLNGRR